MNKYLLLLIGIYLSFNGSVQGQRYIEPLFDEYELLSDIKYGSAVNLEGKTQDLLLDVYHPQGDTAALRPLIIWAHGGSFIGGSKTQEEVTQFAKYYAQAGYVTASIGYRLGIDQSTIFDPPKAERELYKAAMRATQDGKAAIRFFKRSVAENGNPYRIDTSRIMLGGSSAGALLSLHTAYLTTMEELNEAAPAGLLDDIGGGLEGLSGNPGYSTQLKGVINLCGALGKASWIQPGDIPLISMHGDRDNTVPYKYGIAGLPAFGIGVKVEGSYLVDSAAQAAGVKSFFYTWYKADHVPYATDAKYKDSTITYMTPRIYEIMFDKLPPVSNDKVLALTSLNVFPNPSQQVVTVQIPEYTGTVNYRLTDMQGRLIQHASENRSEFQIFRKDIPAGLYILTLRHGNQQVARKIWFE